MQALPPALQGLAAYRQFLLYKLELFPGEKKARKVPLHPTGLYRVSAHDPKAWVDAATACALATALGPPYGVAFSIQRDNGLFFIDIDGALQADNTWSPLAQELCARFPGAAMEVSQSGTGLHILGHGTVGNHACKDIARHIELYTEDRFIALTGRMAHGDVNTRHDAALATVAATYFAPRVGDGVREVAWSEAPVPEWRGPVDDADLLRRALQSRGAAAAFQGKASFADLWEANAGPLAVSYPADTNSANAYDASSADSGLAQHLAFWTGKDCARIERLMLQSGLKRDKWERSVPHYGTDLERTITKAVARQGEVLVDRPIEPIAGAPAPLPPGPPAPPPPDAAGVVAPPPPGEPPAPAAPLPQAVTGDTYLSPGAQIEFFKGCVYVFESHRVLVPGGYLLKPDAFKVRYGGYTFTMDNLNQRTSRDPWEAFTQSQSFRAPRADRTCFRPDVAPGAIISEGSRSLVNVWWPSQARRVRGDPTPFLRHVELLFPNEQDRIIVLSYMAGVIQFPGHKFQWCPLIQGAEGNGKTLLSRCVAEAVGHRYSHWARANQINGKFNSFMLNRIFIGIEDIYVAADRREVWEILKPMITGDMQEIEPKGVDSDTRNVVCNFMLNSNYRNAVQKTRNDRRLAIIYSAQQNEAHVRRDMGGAYFPDLQGWMRGRDGFAITADYLDNYAIDHSVDLMGRAPITSSTDHAIEEGRGSVEQEVMEAIAQSMPGFRKGWVSSMALDNLLVRLKMDTRIPRNMRKAMLESMGYEWHPGLHEGRVNSDVLPDAGKPRLFLQRSHLAWDMTGPTEIARAYAQSQQ